VICYFVTEVITNQDVLYFGIFFIHKYLIKNGNTSASAIYRLQESF